MKIAVLGAGAFGTALGGILADKGYDIDYYDSKVEKERLSDVLKGSKAIVLAVPSVAAPFLLPYLPKTIPLIVATKGLLSDKYFEPFKKFAIISGPGYADDIKAGKQTKLTATDEMVVDLFKTDYLDFDMTSDNKGVLLCGALKNVYAILAGLENLKPGTKPHDEFLKKASREMALVLDANGADSKTVKLVCGEGDLKITCFYPSRNYEFGQKLRMNSNYQPEKTVEGVSALKKIKRGEIIVPKEAAILVDLMQSSEKWA